MAFDRSARVQFWLGLLSWAVVVALYFVGKWRRGRAAAEGEPAPNVATRRKP
jgi:GABA permease